MQHNGSGQRSVPGRIRDFLKEAKRRKVYVSAVAYVAISLATIQVADALVSALNLPAVVTNIVTILLLLGFPIVLLLAWTFDITTEGVRRTEPLPAPRQKEEPRISAVSNAALPTVPESRVKTRMPVEAAPDAERVQRVTIGHLRHELRTPINGIVGYSEMLLEDEEDQAIATDLVRIRDAGHKLLVLIDQALPKDRAGAASPEEMSQLGTRVSAELRTPANAVIGYAELLIESAKETGRTDLLSDLNRILAAGQTLVELSGDIVRLASATYEQFATDPTLVHNSNLAREVLAHIAPVTPGSAIVEGEGTLLVVDDNASNRDLLSRQLARHGYIVETASDGLDALEKLSRREFDTILLDVIMPRLDGIETLKRIRADARLEDVPVLMLSSLDELDSAIRCIELGAEEYLSKPFQPVLLETRIAANVKLRRMRQRDRAFREHLTSTRAVAERLARTVFPPHIASRVLQGERHIEEVHSEATVVACAVLQNVADAQLMERMRKASALIEEAAAQHSLHAVVPRGSFTLVLVTEVEHAQRAAHFALALSAAAAAAEVVLSVGLHSGPVLAAVVGEQRPRFDLIGDSVATAEAVALQARAGAVLVSPTTEHLLRGDFPLAARGVAELPGGVQMRTYTLTAPQPELKR